MKIHNIAIPRPDLPPRPFVSRSGQLDTAVLYVFNVLSSPQHNTIEAVLQRGEKLDDLVEKSEGLTLQSKAFYKTVSKKNLTKDLHSKKGAAR